MNKPYKRHCRRSSLWSAAAAKLALLALSVIGSLVIVLANASGVVERRILAASDKLKKLSQTNH